LAKPPAEIIAIFRIEPYEVVWAQKTPVHT
jgi:hypothetical protein